VPTIKSRRGPTKGDQREQALLDAARALFKEKSISKVTIDELAGIAGFSQRHFIRAFQRSVGQTPLRYVRTLRLEEATRRIAQGESSITSIAIECGFSHVQHLSNSFRQATGMSPSQYRRHHCA